jgi:uncharacterized glyoxalase superfamily protein PhnB
MVFVRVTDGDQAFAEFLERGATIHVPPTDQTWGNREIAMRDPDGNVLVFAPVPKEAEWGAERSC